LVGAFSGQIASVAVAEQAIHVARPVGANHDGLLSVPVARIPVHNDAALCILNVVVLYIEPHRRRNLEEDSVWLTLGRRVGGHTQTIADGQIGTRDAGLDQTPRTANV
jgi:hypothetical protein